MCLRTLAEKLQTAELPSQRLCLHTRELTEEENKINNTIYMRAAAVTHDPVFQKMVNQARGTIGKIPTTQLILGREAETKARLMIALNPESPDLWPFKQLIALMSCIDQDMFISSVGLSDLIDQAWLLIKEFFPLSTYGLPSVGIWAWLFRCLLGEEVQQPTLEDFSLFITFDPENILAMAKLGELTKYCRENGLDMTEFERRYQPVEDKIIDLLAQEQRLFIEVWPATALRPQVDRLGSAIASAFQAGGCDMDSHKIPNHFQEKLLTIFVPHQFQGATLEDVQEALPVIKEIPNISRDYREISDKTSYKRVGQKPRGPGKPR